MRLLIAADIHGSAYFTKLLLKAYEREMPDKLLLLGDLLNQGPRNPRPEDFDNPQVIDLLNSMKNEILCVRGNCDSEVDQFVFEFPIMSDYSTILYGKQVLFATHGHHYNELTPPVLNPGDVLLNGHTHISACEKREEGWFYVNPGSVSLPKGGTINSYILFEDGCFTLKSIHSNPLDMLKI